MSGLRVVTDETPPLTRDELQSRGNGLLRDARLAMIEALHISTGSGLFRGGSFTPLMVKRLHEQAKEAVAAWSNVEAQLGELVREFDKSKAGQ